MVYVPTEKRYEKHIETELNNLIDDGLQFHSKIHKKGDGWYDKNLCVVGSEFMTFLKESQTKTYEKLSKKYGDSIQQKVLSRLNKEIENKGFELSISSVNIDKADFVWSTSISLSQNKVCG